MIHAWNTNRLYGKEGQQIAAETTVDKNGKKKIVFSDVSRMVDGEFYIVKEPTETYVLEEMVMHHYDYGDYAHYAQDDDYVKYHEQVQKLNKYAIEHAPKRKGR